jgi:hypothetical protein
MKLQSLAVILTGLLAVACGSTGTSAPDILDIQQIPEVAPEVIVEVIAEIAVDIPDVEPEVFDVVEVVEIAPELPPPYPEAVILQPLDGKVLNVALKSHFVGQVSDPNDTMEMLTVLWESDIDGEVYEAVPNFEGVVEFDHLGFTPGPHVITMTVTNSAKLSTSKSVSVVMNIPPIGPTVSIEPANPIASEDLHAILVGEASDAEGAEVEVLIDWFEEGEPRNSLDGELTVPAEMTVRGVTWSVVVRAFDGNSYGAAEQDKVTIGNTPPSIESAVIEPEAGNMITEFTCSAKGVADADGDEVTVAYAWLVNEELAVEQETNIFLANQLVKNDSLVCQTTPEDKWDAGVPVLSGPVLIGNNPPSGGEALVEPPAGDKNTVFFCVAGGATDPDGDKVTYDFAWMVNGDPIPGAEGQQLEGGQVKKADILRCRVTPTDGSANGQWFDSNLIVLANIPPTIGGAKILPAEGDSLTTFTCEAIDAFDGDDDLLKSKVVWMVNGDIVLGQSELELAPGPFGKGDEVSCAISLWDGDVWTESVAATESAMVVNTLPTIESVTINPPVGTVETTFSCVADGWTDPDLGDLFEVTYLWLVNGEPADNLGAGTIHSAFFEAGDELVCQVTPENGDEQGVSVSSEAIFVGEL